MTWFHLILPPVAIAAAYLMTRASRTNLRVVAATWLVAIILSFTTGVMRHSPDSEISGVGLGLMCASSGLLLGPLLLGIRPRRTGLTIFICIAAPLASIYLMILLLLNAGAIWNI